MGSIRGFRVTSHIGDGLATFGFGYFFIQFFVYIIVFFLLNTFVIKKSSEFIYAPYARINVFEFLGMFRNAHGITGDIHYCIRGYFEGIVTYFICKSVVIFFAYMFRINYKPH